jgi:hypothetical protein
MACIEKNPVRAGIVREAEQYRWSSAMSHITGTDTDELVQMEQWRRKYTPARWINVLRSTVDAEATNERIREATVRGRPLGDKAFSAHMESIVGRRLTPNPVGRPRKQTELARISPRISIGTVIEYTVPAPPAGRCRRHRSQILNCLMLPNLVQPIHHVSKSSNLGVRLYRFAAARHLKPELFYEEFRVVTYILVPF